MHTVILHGGTKSDTGLESIHEQLCALIRAGGGTVESLRVEEMTIRPCAGCFGCWLRTPGECVHDDDGRVVARALVQTDRRIFLTPVSFGGYGGLLKTAVDRMIPTISPLFQRIDGEMHHRLRYPHPSPFGAVGWQRQPNPAAAEIFTQLARRNAINMHAPAAGSIVLTDGQAVGEQRALLARLLAKLEERQ